MELGKREQIRQSAWLVASLSEILCESSPHLDRGSREAMALLKEQVDRLQGLLASIEAEFADR